METLFAINRLPALTQKFDWSTPLGKVHTSFNSANLSLNPSNAQVHVSAGKQSCVFSWAFSQIEAELLVCRYVPVLPEGFPEAQALAMVWRVKAHMALAELKFAGEIQCDLQREPSPETGEGLDALTWTDEAFNLTLGTEATDFLLQRAEIGKWFPPRHSPWLRSIEEEHANDLKYPVFYQKNGLCLEIPDLLIGETLQCHFIAAWAQPDEEKPASWFAADASAEWILKQVDS